MGQSILMAPAKVFLTKGVGYADSRLNAFDTALLDARVGEVSLIKVTSILPTNVVFAPVRPLPFGASVPAIYSSYVTDEPGIISSAIGYIRTCAGPTLVAESSGATPLDEQKRRVEQYLSTMQRARGRDAIGPPVIEGIEAPVKRITCTFAGIIYLE